MKRTNFTFSRQYAGQHRLGSMPVKTAKGSHLARKTIAKLRSFWQQSLQQATVCKAGVAFGVAMTFGITANAQCKTFQNADAANSITKLLRGTEEIFGLDFVDIDADGDLDCYAKIYSDETYIPAIPILFRNIGTPALPVFKRDDNTGFSTKDDGFYTFNDIQFADMDGDGDFDCFIGESYSFGGTTIHYYENQGTPTQPKFVENEAANPVGFAYAFYGITFTIADIDHDGDLDLAYTTDFGFYGSGTYFNTGTKTQPQFQQHSMSPQSWFTRVYYDFNKDGLPDYVDNSYGTQNEYLNLGPKEDPKYKLNPPNGPQFNNGVPYRFADLNNDGFAEVFNFHGGYATTAPVAVINAKEGQTGGFAYIQLTSVNQSHYYTYQWKLNGADIPGATSATYYATRKGKYTLTVTGGCGTGISLPYIINTALSAQAGTSFIVSGLPSASKPGAIRIYPNPFVSTLTISLPLSKETSLVKVMDAAGKTLISLQTNETTVTTGNTLKPGMYVVQLWQKGGLVLMEKVVKE